MIFLILFLYVLVCMLYFGRRVKWLKKHFLFYESPKFRVLLLVMCILLVVSVLLTGLLPTSDVQIVLQKISSYWIGFFFNLVFVLLLVDLFVFLLRLVDRKKRIRAVSTGKMYVYAGITVIILTMAVSIYGYIHAGHITRSTYEVTVDQSNSVMDELTIALVSDLHLGYDTDEKMISDMVDEINKIHPDLVIIAGDIFNNDYDEIENPDQLIEILGQMESTYGSYAVFGNHDVTEDLIAGFTIPGSSLPVRDPRMNVFLTRAGIQILSDQSTEIAEGSICLIGRLDKMRPGDGTNHRKSLEELMNGLDSDKLMILIDHEPEELEEASKLGIDLMLSGHTHNGQFVPFQLVQKLNWDNGYGKKQIGGMYSFVTSGVGTFTPNMRTLTNAEVMQITVHFSKNESSYG